MKVLITALVLTLVTSFASANTHQLSCPKYTPEQEHLLELAYSIGSQYNPDLLSVINTHVGNTLAAMVVQESFVAEHVIRWRSSDGDYGSYGVMMVQFTTAFFMDDISNTWYNRDKYGPYYISSFMTNDQFAITYGYRYLKRMIVHQYGAIVSLDKVQEDESYYNAMQSPLWRGVRAYNGTGERADNYMLTVRELAQTFVKCGKFK